MTRRSLLTVLLGALAGVTVVSLLDSSPYGWVSASAAVCCVLVVKVVATL